MDTYTDIMDFSINSSEDYMLHVIEYLDLSKVPTELSCKETASLLMGRCELSQRSYKALKSVLCENNVKIPHMIS